MADPSCVQPIVNSSHSENVLCLHSKVTTGRGRGRALHSNNWQRFLSLTSFHAKIEHRQFHSSTLLSLFRTKPKASPWTNPARARPRTSRLHILATLPLPAHPDGCTQGIFSSLEAESIHQSPPDADGLSIAVHLVQLFVAFPLLVPSMLDFGSL